jgi:hypothetical protein
MDWMAGVQVNRTQRRWARLACESIIEVVRACCGGLRCNASGDAGPAFERSTRRLRRPLTHSRRSNAQTTQLPGSLALVWRPLVVMNCLQSQWSHRRAHSPWRDQHDPLRHSTKTTCNFQRIALHPITRRRRNPIGLVRHPGPSCNHRSRGPCPCPGPVFAAAAMHLVRSGLPHGSLQS